MGTIKLKNVKSFKAKGREYHYHRPTGTRIKARYGTKAFVDEVTALNEALKELPPPRPGTWGALVLMFRQSDEFAALAPRTRQDYERRVFKFLDAIRDVPLSKIDGPSMFQLRDKAAKMSGVRLANYVLQCMSRVFNWGIPRGHCFVNPARGVPKLKSKGKTRANRPWKPDEVKTVLDTAPPKLRLVLVILMHTGLRTSDAIALRWDHYKDGLFNYRPSKNDFDLWITPTATLREAVAEAERSAVTIATNAHGRPWGIGGLRSAWRRHRQKLERAGDIAPGLTLHGIRHTVGNILADEGFDTATIAKALGHKTEVMARHYSDRASRKEASASVSATISRLGK